MADLAQVSSQIRFQLSELGARNAHHLFEELCLFLARARLYSNLLPATGPVSGGGDGGRDFETYPTHLTEDSSAGSSFLARAADQPIAFACTLQQEALSSKIRTDVRKCTQATPPFQRMYFMATANIRVAERQKLETEARTDYQVELTILDGQAITAMLTDPDVYWIAERFLNLPSDLYPRVAGDDDWYAQARERWLTAPAPGFSDAEFHDIRRASRHAVAEERLKPDLRMWLERLEAFAQGQPGMLRRKARYEILYTRLRGLGTWAGEESMLEEFMAGVAILERADELQEAHNMLLWSEGARGRGLVNLSEKKLQTWHQEFDDRIAALLSAFPRTGYRCRLLEFQAVHALLRFDAHSPEERVQKALLALQELITLIPQVPLYPVEHLQKVLSTYLRLVGDEPALEPILDALEPLIGQQRGNAAQAELVRDRAMRAWRTGDLLRAAEHAHRAKILWFTERTLHGTLLSLMLLAEIYSHLNLHFAAKYYALAAAYLAFHSGDSDDRSMVSKALLQAALSDHRQGAWASFLDLLAAMFMAHNALSQNVALPQDERHIEEALGNLFLLRAVARKLGGDAEAYVSGVLQGWQMDLEDYFANAEQLIEKFSELSDEQLQRSVQEQLHGPPFADLGPRRRVEFTAQGITWTAEWPNDPATTAGAEEFLAGLQVVLADVASTDLGLLPLKVYLALGLSDGTEVNINPLVSQNAVEQLGFQIELPIEDDPDDAGLGMAGPLTGLLAQCSLLPDDELFEILGERFKDGLLGKLFLARPYRELFRNFQIADDIRSSGRAARTVEWPQLISAPSHPALEPPSGPGPHDDRTEALDSVAARYKNITRLLPITLPRLAAEPAFQAVIQKLRGEGWKDWHLLNAVFNVALNLRTPIRSRWDRRSPGLPAPETQQDFRLPLDRFTEAELRQHLRLSQASTVKSMGLRYRLELLFPEAINQVLGDRYGYWTDDVPHDDPFPSP